MEITTNTRKNYLRPPPRPPLLFFLPKTTKSQGQLQILSITKSLVSSLVFIIIFFQLEFQGLDNDQFDGWNGTINQTTVYSIGAKFLKFYLKLKTLKCNKFPAGKQCLLWKLFGVCCIPLFCLSSHPPLFHLSALLLSQKIFNLWRFVFRLPDIPKHCATSKNWQPQLISCPQIPQKLVRFFCFAFVA